MKKSFSHLCILLMLLVGSSELISANSNTRTNLKILSVVTVDSTGTEIIPKAGEPFYIQVSWNYNNPLDTIYAITRIVNKFSVPNTDFTNFGVGSTGMTFWVQSGVQFLIHESGVYPVTVILDSENNIPETNEFDNAMTVNIVVAGDITPEWKLVKADFGREKLGDGTDVIVGTMDDAFDYLHPWFRGKDSLGRPRLIAALQNTDRPDGGPYNAEHATAVMGIVLSKGLRRGDITGLAPDARYVTAEFIDRVGGTGGLRHVFDAAGFLVRNNVDCINMCWSWFADQFEATIGEGAITNLMADYLAYNRNIVCIAAVNQLRGDNGEILPPTAPGAARNVITVGGLEETLTRVWSEQNSGPTVDGRFKPDLIGNGAVQAVATSTSWQNGIPAAGYFIGTSFATPFVTGAVAQMIDYGKHHHQNLDHKVIKAIIMNSGDKVRRSDGTPWNAPSGFQPLDNEQGTGLLNIEKVYQMYSAGEQHSGRCKAQVPGYDLKTITGIAGNGNAGKVIYNLGSPQCTNGYLDITMTWDRHTFWDDSNSNGEIDSPDNFYTNAYDTMDNLDIRLYCDNKPVAGSFSLLNNVEYIHFTDLIPGKYRLEVERLDVPGSGKSEDYAIAFYSSVLWD